MIKQLKFFTQLGFVFLAIFTFCGSSYAAKKNGAIPLDGIVATVNDQVITQSELSQAIEAIKKQIASSNTSMPPMSVLRKQVLDQLINKKLEMQLAETMGIHITDEQVNKAIKDIAASNKMTTAELLQKVNDSGVSTSDYHKEIHDELMLQEVQQQAVASRIAIAPQEIDDFMRSKSWQAFNAKEYHLEDILITLPEAPTSQDVAAAKHHAEAVLAKLHNGMSFSEAAAAESGDKNALQGGDLGWRKLPEIPSAFAEKLVNMKVNDLLGPVQTPNGFHIVRLTGVRSTGDKMTPTQMRVQVQQLIFQRKLEEGLQSWVTKLRSEAFINTHPES